MKNLLFTFLLLLLFWNANASFHQLKGKTIDANGNFLPFIHYSINHGEHEGVTQITGEFEINFTQRIDTITFYSYQHDSIDVIVCDTNTYIEIKLENANANLKLTKSDERAAWIIRNAVARKKQNRPEELAPFYYETYNKFIITTNKIHKTVKVFNRFLNKLKTSVKDLPENHHIVLSESTTERRYLNSLNEDEIVTASRISGIDQPGLLTANSQIQLFSIYNDYLLLASKKFTSPLNIEPLSRYHFHLLDVIHNKNDSTYVIQFYPLATARFESLKGYLYINSATWAVEEAILKPAIDKKASLEVYQNCEKLTNGAFFPKETFTKFHVSEIGKERIDLTVIIKSSISAINVDTNFRTSTFDEYAFKHHVSENENENYWSNKRTIPFSTKDQNTYTFYDSVGTLKQFERALNFGERIYFKEIPYKKVNFKLSKLALINGHEYLRLGAGVRTNEKFSKQYELSAYAGFGIGDLKTKYGAAVKYFLKDDKLSTIKLSYSDDLVEAGATDFYNDNSQFSTEWIRNLFVRTMDNERKASLDFKHHFWRYAILDASFIRSYYAPQYNYTYNFTETQFNFTKLQVGININYGERFFKVLNERVSIGSKYPKFWLQYTKGISILGSNYDYWQLDSKVQQNIQILDFGKFTYQLQAGIKSIGMPYPALYSSKSNTGAVSHNSFETMRWNEFASDKHIDLFLSHDFGYFNYLHLKHFRPKLELAFNAGFSQLNKESTHTFERSNIQAFDYPKGYYEAGFVFNNLISINYSGVKFGLGAGYYMRMGYYALNTFQENSKIKIALQIKL